MNLRIKLGRINIFNNVFPFGYMVCLHSVRAYNRQHSNTIFFMYVLHVSCEVYSFIVYGLCCSYEWNPFVLQVDFLVCYCNI